MFKNLVVNFLTFFCFIFYFINKIKKVSDHKSLDLVKTEIFGKKGILTELFKKIGSLDQSQKKEYASKLNSLKIKVTEILKRKIIDFGQS